MGTLWYGGTVRPLRHENDAEEAVYTEQGRITAVGSYEELTAKYYKHISEEINLHGAAMYPGFVDSHMHMIGHGEKLLKLDVSDVTSINELIRVLKKASETVAEGEWVVAEGFNENLYENYTVPDRHILDQVSLHHPVMLTRVCRHAIVTNTYGLKLAGIDAETINPPGGLIEKDGYGLPTGYLHDQAQELIKEHLPKQGMAYIEEALKASLEDLYRKGYTGAHTEDLNYYGDPVQTLQTFINVIDGEKNKFKVNLLVHHEAASVILTDRLIGENHYIEAGAVKIFADGALGGRTALLSKPYADDSGTNGVAIHTRETLSLIVRDARQYGMPVAIHTIGDEALEYAIEAIEAYPAPEGRRDRLIHLQVTRKELIDRLQALPVALDIQPRFVASDFPWVEERLGRERLNDSFPWKTLIDSGLVCAGGSDAPIEPIDPMLGLHAAVTRRKPEESHSGYNSREKLTLYEAVKLFTSGSAAAICKEDTRGIIAPGYEADFTILSEDLFLLEPDQWLNVTVEKTVVDNTVMYEKKAK